MFSGITLEYWLYDEMKTDFGHCNVEKLQILQDPLSDNTDKTISTTHNEYTTISTNDHFDGWPKTSFVSQSFICIETIFITHYGYGFWNSGLYKQCIKCISHLFKGFLAINEKYLMEIDHITIMHIKMGLKDSERKWKTASCDSQGNWVREEDLGVRRAIGLSSRPRTL